MKHIELMSLMVMFGVLIWTDARAELVVYYNFDDVSDAAIAVDTSGKDNNGVVNVATYSADGGGHTGLSGDRALDLGAFDNGAHVDIAGAANGAFDTLTSNDATTISLWINGGDEQPANQFIFFAGPGRQLSSHLPWGDGTIYFDVVGCCGANNRIAKNEPDSSNYSGAWNHYAYVKDGGTTAVYQNGALFIESADGVIDPLGAITEFYLGSGATSDQRSYNGLIDDFAVWDEALPAERIAEIAGGGAVIPEPTSHVMAAVAVLAIATRRRRRTSQIR